MPGRPLSARIISFFAQPDFRQTISLKIAYGNVPGLHLSRDNPMMKLRQPAALALACAVVATVCPAVPLHAEVRLPAMFTDHAVLQRDMPVPVWGWADPGEKVTVTIAGQTHKTKADDKGNWLVKLDPLQVGKPLTMTVTEGNEAKSHVEVNDIRVGEVWLCSGQSNMEFPLGRAANGDLEVAAANHPDIRLVRVKEPGSQTPVKDFHGQWEVCKPAAAAGFSAVGYFFGLELHDQLQVPIGLIDDSWGGSSCEAWIRRDRLEGNPLYADLLKRWDDLVKNWDKDKANADLAAWRKKAAAARKAGKPRPVGRPEAISPAVGNHRPANLYHARVEPIMPYAIRGVIWYQGESNADRAYQYRDMFPLLIKSWREDWRQGEFPFYWVQLADFMAQKPQPSESAWAELREAQTMTQDRLPNTGQAVIIDLGEASDIHPRNKMEVGRRLARWALARDYGRDIVCQSPRYDSMEKKGNKILVKFKDVAGGLRSVDAKRVEGFAIAGADRNWVWAKAQILKPDHGAKADTVEVWNNDVPEPVAVRYAWADNPVCNLYNESLLPVTPFRTDDWPGITAKAK
ncbi:MAG TPA: sialate O-acetylesterase [Lacipirellulaceae bacterium]|nr:sialate O-acetylesterase [Lacipirellulaceae bacterium]